MREESGSWVSWVSTNGRLVVPSMGEVEGKSLERISKLSIVVRIPMMQGWGKVGRE